MKILIVAPCNLNNQVTGFGKRILHLAKALSYKGGKVTILHYGTNQKNEYVEVVGCSSLKHKMNSKNLTLGAIDRYLSPFNPALIKATQDLLHTEIPDILQVESPYPFAPSYLLKRLSQKTLVSLDAHNVEFSSVLSKLDRREPLVTMTTGITLPYVFIVETFAVTRSDIILSVSRNDAQSLMALYRIKQDKIWTVPNGVDMSLFDKIKKSSKEPLFGTHSKVVLFHGTLSWYPNLEAASIIVDLIAPSVPQVNFVICGSNPPSSLLHRISKNENTKYAGYVHNIARYITNCDVCVAPILGGGGTKMKMLEYAVAGKPIVATYKAAEGLPLVNQVHALLFKDVGEGFIEGVRRVLSDENLAEKIGANARQLAVKFDWKVIGSKLYDRYTLVLDR